MSDFFKKDDDDAPKPTEGEDAAIKLGDKEYTPEELKSLVEDGEFKRDVESKQNTKLDKVFGEYTKLTQEKKTWEDGQQELDTLKQEKEDAEKPAPQFDEATIAKAQEEARKLGLFTKEDVQKLIYESFPTEYTKQRLADKVIEGGQALEKEIDGEDGRPKFILSEVLEHMKDTGIKDPNRAYKDKYETELDKWKEKKFADAKGDSIYTDTSSTAGSKQPEEVKITKDNVAKQLREALRGSK